MGKDIYSKPGYVTTNIEGKTIVVTWEKLYDAQTIYDSCKAQMEAVQKDEANMVIIDISQAKGTPPMECQQWFGSDLFPGFSKNPNFKGLVNVLPKEAIAKMGANRWKKTADSGAFGFDVYESDSVDAAKQLARSL